MHTKKAGPESAATKQARKPVPYSSAPIVMHIKQGHQWHYSNPNHFRQRINVKRSRKLLNSTAIPIEWVFMHDTNCWMWARPWTASQFRRQPSSSALKSRLSASKARPLSMRLQYPAPEKLPAISKTAISLKPDTPGPNSEISLLGQLNCPIKYKSSPKSLRN